MKRAVSAISLFFAFLFSFAISADETITTTTYEISEQWFYIFWILGGLALVFFGLMILALSLFYREKREKEDTHYQLTQADEEMEEVRVQLFKNQQEYLYDLKEQKVQRDELFREKLREFSRNFEFMFGTLQQAVMVLTGHNLELLRIKDTEENSEPSKKHPLATEFYGLPRIPDHPLGEIFKKAVDNLMMIFAEGKIGFKIGEITFILLQQWLKFWYELNLFDKERTLFSKGSIKEKTAEFETMKQDYSGSWIDIYPPEMKKLGLEIVDHLYLLLTKAVKKDREQIKELEAELIRISARLKKMRQQYPGITQKGLSVEFNDPEINSEKYHELCGQAANISLEISRLAEHSGLTVRIGYEDTRHNIVPVYETAKPGFFSGKTIFDLLKFKGMDPEKTKFMYNDDVEETELTTKLVNGDKITIID